MAETWLYKLEPRSPFHFGVRGVGIEATEEVFHSDSLFSALCFGVRMWRGEGVLRELLAAFQKSPPFLVSSLLPYAREVLLFPKPCLYIQVSEGERPRLKDVRFVSQEVLLALLKGMPLEGELAEGNLLQEGAVWVTRGERERLEGLDFIWQTGRLPRVTVDRASSSSQIFHLGRVRYAEGCGLYFLLRLEDAFYSGLVDDALSYLEEAGLGGERSLGSGSFKVKRSPFTPPWPKEGDGFITLSLYHPTLEELQAGILKQPAAYELVLRRGWVGSPERGGHRRKSVYFLGEGSLLRTLGRDFYGDLADVTPEIEPEKHPVFRYGFAFPIPVTLKEGNDEG
jgi:CRISPR-associated protein Csm4